MNQFLSFSYLQHRVNYLTFHAKSKLPYSSRLGQHKIYSSFEFYKTLDDCILQPTIRKTSKEQHMGMQHSQICQNVVTQMKIDDSYPFLLQDIWKLQKALLFWVDVQPSSVSMTQLSYLDPPAENIYIYIYIFVVSTFVKICIA